MVPLGEGLFRVTPSQFQPWRKVPQIVKNSSVAVSSPRGDRSLHKIVVSDLVGFSNGSLPREVLPTFNDYIAIAGIKLKNSSASP